jgi:hypothetical protein
MEMDI